MVLPVVLVTGSTQSLLGKCTERFLEKGSSAPGPVLALLAEIHSELRSLPCQFLLERGWGPVTYLLPLLRIRTLRE